MFARQRIGINGYLNFRKRLMKCVGDNSPISRRPHYIKKETNYKIYTMIQEVITKET